MRLVLTSVLAALAAGCVEDVPADGAWPDRYQPIRGEAPLAYVSNNGSDDVSVIELRSMTEIARVSVGASPVDPEAPHHLAIDPVGHWVYVGISNVGLFEGGGLHDAHGGGALPGFVERRSLVDFSPQGTVRVDPNLGDVVLDGARTKIVTTHFDLARAIAALAAGEPARAGYGALIVVDPTEMDRAGRVEVCTAPHGVALTADGAKAVVACYGEDGVAIVDLTGDQPDVIAQVPAGPSPGDVRRLRYGPYAIALSPDESIAYVSTLDGIRVLDMATRTMSEARMVPLTGIAFFGSFDAAGTSFWVSTQARDGVARIDVATNTIAVERFFTGDACIAPHEATLVPALDRVLVVCEGDHILPGSVLALDPITLETEGRVEIGVYPDALRIVDEVDW